MTGRVWFHSRATGPGIGPGLGGNLKRTVECGGLFWGFVRIPLMVITDSGLTVISSERSDAGVFIIPEVIGMGQG